MPTGRCFFGSTAVRCEAGPVRLHTEWIAPEKNSGNNNNNNNIKNNDYTILFMHGLLGNGRNLKSFARKVVKQESSNGGSCLGGFLLDLRGHGRSFQNQIKGKESSGSYDKASTFRDCVLDIAHTLEELHADDEHLPPARVVVGHSFGGRLALEYAADAEMQKNPLKALWLLDTVPGRANKSVDRVLATITNVLAENSNGTSPPTKKEIVNVLTGAPHNMDLPTAQWLAMSYNEKTGGDFGFDNDFVTRTKPEFVHQDFMGLLRKILGENNNNNDGVAVHLVRGGKNTDWSIPVLSELEKLRKEFPATFHLHVLPFAGHNVHADDLPGLIKLIAGTTA